MEGPHVASAGQHHSNVSSTAWNTAHKGAPLSPSMAPGNQPTFTPPPRQNVIHRGSGRSVNKCKMLQPHQSISPQSIDRYSPLVAASKNALPRNSHIYPPSSHDAFAALVDAAVAQPSLAIPNREERKATQPSPHMREEFPRERSASEGLEQSLIEMHRPRTNSDSHLGNDCERPIHSNMPIDVEREHQQRRLYMQYHGTDERRYITDSRRSLEYSRIVNEQRIADADRERQIVREPGPLTISGAYKLPSSREPFTREQFERELRQQDVESSSRDDKMRTAVPGRVNHESKDHQIQLEQEASRMLCNSFQKDDPKAPSSSKGFTDIIAEIIKHQINQPEAGQSNVKGRPHSGSGSNFLFNRYAEEQRSGNETKVAGADVASANNGLVQPSSIAESFTIQNRSPMTEPRPQLPNSTHMSGDKAITLGEHIAAIISKNYSSSPEMPTTQTFGGHNRHDALASSSKYYVPENRRSPARADSVDSADKSSHHGWKPRKTVQYQDRDMRSNPAVADGSLGCSTTTYPVRPDVSASTSERPAQTTQNGPSQSTDYRIVLPANKLSAVSSYQVRSLRLFSSFELIKNFLI